MRQHDRNHNGRLEGDEIREMPGEHRSADRNRDGVITRDELAVRLEEYSRSRDRDHDSRDGGSSDSDRSRSGSSQQHERKTYRFLSPAERWPEGLPDWFARKDTDGDGQVAMAEYASFWTISSANEFGRYDLNGDGIITPRECLQTPAGPSGSGGETAPEEKPEKKDGEVAKSEEKGGGELWQPDW